MHQEATAHALAEATDATFATTVLAAELPVVVDFWAPWCPPCRPMSKVLTELAEELTGQLVAVTINHDDNPVAGQTYRVLSLPTLLVFRDGEVIGSIVGLRPKTYLRQALLTLLASR